MDQDNLKNNWLNAIVKLYEKQLMLDKNIMSGTKKEKVENYLEVLEQARQEVIKSGSVELENLFKNFYYDLYVIKEENIPYSVYEAEQRIAREQGHGTIPITEEYKKRKNEQIISDQILSLNKWLDYFLYDDESKIYKPWEIFWVLEGLQKLGKFDKEKQTFTKRDKNTIYPFPEVDKAAVFNTLNLMEEYLKSKKGPEELKNALSQSNFKQLYEYSLKKLYFSDKEKDNETKGIWKKYNQGSDYRIMRNDLQGKMTGWCIEAGENFAKDYLDEGDFYIYYTMDKEGDYTNPRIAIRTLGPTEIAEIRGILNDQNMEPEMLPILDEKLKEFPDRDNYLKKVHDMKYLTAIEKKVNSKIELSLEELEFLYEIDYEIEGFGWEEDPRIEEIKSKRKKAADLYFLNASPQFQEKVKKDMDYLNKLEIKINSNIELTLDELKFLYEIRHKIYSFGQKDNLNAERIRTHRNQKKDLSIIFNCSESEIATSNKEVNKNTKLFFGNINLSMQTAENLKFPAIVKGNVELSNLEFVETIYFPYLVFGNVDLHKLLSAHYLRFSKSVNGDIFLDHLFNIDILELPESIGGHVSLERLKTIEKIVLPKKMRFDLYLTSLNSTVGLIFPDELTYNIYLANNVVITPENVDEYRTSKKL